MNENHEFLNSESNQVLFKTLDELTGFMDELSPDILTENANSNPYRKYVCETNLDWVEVSVKLLALLADGRVDDKVITDIDKVIRFREVFTVDYEFFYEFLFWFYERDLKKTDITDNEGIKIDPSHYMSKKELENCVKAFDTEALKNIGKARYIFNLEKQLGMGLISKDCRFDTDRLINRFVGRAVKNTNILFDMIKPGEQIDWDQLKNILRHKSITDFNKLLGGTVIFDKKVLDDGCIDNKINCSDLSLFNGNSVRDYQAFFDKCTDDAIKFCILDDDMFNIFQPGAFKNFDIDNKQTLKSYGLNKKSILNYPVYALLDIVRAIVYMLSGGKKYSEGLFYKSKKLYTDNCNIEKAINRIKKNKIEGIINENKLTDIVGLQKILELKTDSQAEPGKNKNMNMENESI